MVYRTSKHADGVTAIAAANLSVRPRRLPKSLFFAVVFSFAASSAALCQSASFRSVDTNSDGMLSFDELVAAFGRDGARQLMRTNDYNGDNRLTIGEIRRGARDEPERGTSQDGSDDDDDDDDDDDRDERDDDDDNGGGGDGGGGDSDGGDDGGDDDD